MNKPNNLSFAVENWGNWGKWILAGYQTRNHLSEFQKFLNLSMQFHT
jgi:hypothetical protein